MDERHAVARREHRCAVSHSCLGIRRRATTRSSILRLAEHSHLLHATRGGSLRVCGGYSIGAFVDGKRGASAFAATRREGHVVLNRLRGVRDTG